MHRLNSDRRATNLVWYERAMQYLSLTELPQLLNVLKGDMALVGPRPEGLDRADYYTDWHRQRLLVKPGMTGLAQVHGLRDQSSSEDKTRFDLQYILHNSAFQDISLLLQTVCTLVGRVAGMPRHLLSSASSCVATSQPIGVANAVPARETLPHAHRS